MKKLALFILGFGYTAASINGQVLPVDVKPVNIIKPSWGPVCGTLTIRNGEQSDIKPLVIVDGIETEMQSIALNAANIEKIDVLKGEKALKEYGIKAKEGVIIISTKPGTEFFRINDFVDPEKNLNKSISKVQLDGVVLTDMKKILVDKSVFKQTMISSNMKLDEQDCSLTGDNTLVITTTLKEQKE